MEYCVVVAMKPEHVRLHTQITSRNTTRVSPARRPRLLHMIEFNPATFETVLLTIVADADSDHQLDEIDDALQQQIFNSDDARACAYLAAEILSRAERPWPLAYALNTAISASCMAGDTKRVRRYLKQLVDLTIEKGTDLAALSATENVRHFLPGNAKADHVPNILYEVVRLYLHLEKFDKAIETLIVAAYLFADFGAFRTAYQSIADAEDIARDNELHEEYANVVSAAYAISLLEGDHTYAETLWPILKQKYVELRRPIPIHLAVNRATLLFQTGDYAPARKAFEEALENVEVGKDHNEGRAKILINLSACLRELGEYVLSDACIEEARQLFTTIEYIDPEHLLEAELIAAKNAVAKADPVEAAVCLNRAAKHFDDGIGLVEKLHYRRGFRERYVSRFERLLTSLATTGRAVDVIPVVAATRSNRVSDWLHFLEWARLLAGKLSPKENEELNRLVDNLAQHGSPHLFGYLEKYDDPMAAMKMPDPWVDIAEYSDKVSARYGVGRPFQNATSDHIAEAIVDRLGAGYAVLVNMASTGHKVLLLIDDRYILCDLPRAEINAFFEALLRHRHVQGQTKTLGLAVGAYQTALLRSLAPVLNELAVDSCKGIIFVPEGLDLMPINLVMVGDPKIRARMSNGEFDVRTCIALYPATRHCGAPGTCLGIVEGDSGLKYDRADIERFVEGTGATETLLENPTWDSFAEAMKSTDAMVLSHHGASVDLFRDPYFADMAGPYRHSAMQLARLQGAAFRWPHRFVVLGTCHSGSLVNRNFQTRFNSHDLMGFPIMFLLNGRSEVLAASWAIIDRFNLLLTTLFAPKLQKVHPSLAASTALAKLFELPEAELADLVHRAFPADASNSPVLLKQIDNLRQQPFCYGAYQTYTLL